MDFLASIYPDIKFPSRNSKFSDFYKFEFCYLFSYDAKNIILNTWEKFLRIWVEFLPKGDLGQAGGLRPIAPSDHKPKNSDAFETKPFSE